MPRRRGARASEQRSLRCSTPKATRSELGRTGVRSVRLGAHELVLAAWLLVKGFSPSAVGPGPAATIPSAAYSDVPTR